MHDAQFIRSTEEGWKLQTAQEKNWETERRGSPRTEAPGAERDHPASRCEQIFGEPAFKTYRYQNYRIFRIGISVEGSHLGDEGDLPLTL